MLVFSEPNSKLRKLKKELKRKEYIPRIYSLDLPSGYSCPNADKCQSFATGTLDKLRIVDGKNAEFRCFSASQEVLYRNVFLRRMNNFRTIKSLITKPKQLVELLHSSIPPKTDIVRFHCAGDFFRKNYFRAAIEVARKNPHIIFYGYTKQVRDWAVLSKQAPSNFRITISIGGKEDKYIEDWMVTARVINHKEDAAKYNLPIDIDDSHAYYNKSNFLLLIHGVQKGRINARSI